MQMEPSNFPFSRGFHQPFSVCYVQSDLGFEDFAMLEIPHVNSNQS